MRIIADENILGAGPCFGQFGEVSLLPGRSLSREKLNHCDALIVRSVTRVDRALLEGSPVRFVGSCTIGTDHLDIPYLQRQGVGYGNAPGSNANSVVDYVLSAAVSVPGLWERLVGGAGVGIIGLGNVGGRVARRLTALGISCRAYDPFLVSAHDTGAQLVPLNGLRDCKLLCLHTPLSRTGSHPTYHLLDADWLAGLPEGAVVLNAGRGEVLATAALLELKQRRPDIQLVLDVWENEPAIDGALAAQCLLATPHIAGYSADGKLDGVRQVGRALATFLGREFQDFPPPPELAQAPEIHLADGSPVEVVRRAVRGLYDIREDDRRFRQVLAGVDAASGFDALRKHYPLRRELNACRIDEGSLSRANVALLRALCGKPGVADADL